MTIALKITASLTLGPFASLSSAQVRFDVIAGLGDAGFGSSACAVTPDGRIVVGHTDVPGCPFCVGVPFKWTEETGVTILDPNLRGVVAYAASSDAAYVVGISPSPHDGIPPCDTAYRWSSDGTMWFEKYTEAFGISDDGNVIAGGINFPSRWTPDTGWTDLGRMPDTSNFGGVARAVSSDGAVIVGSAYSDVPQPSFRAFRWTAETGMQPLADLLPPAHSDTATAISRDGRVIVGYATLPPSRSRAVRWTESGAHFLGEFPGYPYGTRAAAVSADGSVIVGTYGEGASTLALLWDERRGPRDLRTELINEYGVDLANFRLRGATGISVDGRVIVGFGNQPGQPYRAWRVSLGWDCAPDTNHDGRLDSADFFAFLTRFFSLTIDFNADGLTDSQDLFDYLAAYFAGC